MYLGQVILGRFQADEAIQEGGQGTVYRGHDMRSGLVVAIKETAVSPLNHNSAELLARAQREAQIRIGHPHVNDPIAGGMENGSWYTVSPFVDGPTLERHVQDEGGPLDADQGTEILRQTAEGLGAIHARHIIHRDLKPPNIMRSSAGWVIIDLGVSRKLRERTIGVSGALIGTLSWMSPEQIAHPDHIDHRSDLFSLGSVAYFMLTGVRPFDDNDPGKLAVQICHHQPPSLRQVNPDVAESLDVAVMTLLAKDRQKRWQTAKDFIRAMRGEIAAPWPGRYCSACGASTVVPNGAEPRFCMHCRALLGAEQSLVALCLACGAAVGESPTCTVCHRVFSPTDHRLRFTTGELARKVFRVPVGKYQVGRAQLAPTAALISHRHFNVACANGTVAIQDAGSVNKTFVNGRLASTFTRLRVHQQLCIAGFVAAYSIS